MARKDIGYPDNEIKLGPSGNIDNEDMEDYKKKYEEAVQKAMDYASGKYPEALVSTKAAVELIFPELKVSEDERIRKEILEYFQQFENGELRGVNISDWIAWLEKQGEQKQDPCEHCKDRCLNCHNFPCIIKRRFEQGKTALEAVKEEKVDNANKVEPKFHEGDWVVTSYGKVNQVIDVDEDGDEFTLDDDTYFSGSWKDNYHLYTLQDAKDGDVLVTVNDKRPFLYKGRLDPNHPDSPVAYCGIDTEGDFCLGGDNFKYWWTDEKVQPATKEQRDRLEKAMADAGYIFDFENKELKKIEEKSADWLQELEGKLANATPKQLAEWKEKYFNEEPAEWNEDDEEKFRDVIRLIEQGAPVQSMRDHYTNWLKSLKDRVQPQTKPELSEEDERNIKDSIFYLKSAKKYLEKDDDILWDEKWFNLCIEWLESLKEKVQPQSKQEWSEEDERLRTSCIKHVEEELEEIRNDKYGHSEIISDLKESCRERIDWLKSLKPKSHWKPSEEQLDALHDAAVYVDKFMFPHPKGILMKMYEQLKKLREEQS